MVVFWEGGRKQADLTGLWEQESHPHSRSPSLRLGSPVGLSLPQLVLLNEATLVLVQDVEHLPHVLRALLLQAHHLEELFVVEGVNRCGVERSGLKCFGRERAVGQEEEGVTEFVG